VRKAHVPLGFIRPVARILHRLPGFPVTPDQLRMLEEDNICDPAPFYGAFRLEPMPLATGLRRMLG
jgi:NADH dehydrogenase